MEHVVFYPGAGGAPSFQRLSSLEAAVSYVERLRNGANVTEFSVYELTPVPLSMRTYYRVEVPAGESDDVEPAEELAVPAVEQAVQFALGDVSDSIVRPQTVEPETEPEPQASQEPELADAAGAQLELGDESTPDPGVATSEILTAAAAAAAYVRTETQLESELDEDDRSAEWVAQASVIEPAFVTPSLPVLPAADEPVAAQVADGIEPDADKTHFAVAPSVAVPLPPPLQVTPFAVAPPVGSSIPAPLAPEPADVADFPVEPEAGDVVAAIPADRRSLGFFAR